jgi:hypothetical protein
MGSRPDPSAAQRAGVRSARPLRRDAEPALRPRRRLSSRSAHRSAPAARQGESPRLVPRRGSARAAGAHRAPRRTRASASGTRLGRAVETGCEPEPRPSLSRGPGSNVQAARSAMAADGSPARQWGGGCARARTTARPRATSSDSRCRISSPPKLADTTNSGGGEHLERDATCGGICSGGKPSASTGAGISAADAAGRGKRRRGRGQHPTSLGLGRVRERAAATPRPFSAASGVMPSASSRSSGASSGPSGCVASLPPSAEGRVGYRARRPYSRTPAWRASRAAVRLVRPLRLAHKRRQARNTSTGVGSALSSPAAAGRFGLVPGATEARIVARSAGLPGSTGTASERRNTGTGGGLDH